MILQSPSLRQCPNFDIVFSVLLSPWHYWDDVSQGTSRFSDLLLLSSAERVSWLSVSFMVQNVVVLGYLGHLIVSMLFWGIFNLILKYFQFQFYLLIYFGLVGSLYINLYNYLECFNITQMKRQNFILFLMWS